MDQLINNIDYSLSKLEWLDFSDFVKSNNYEDNLKVSLEIEFGMEEPKKVDNGTYLTSIVYILNFVDKNEISNDGPPETISLIKSILSVYIVCEETDSIDFENLQPEDRNILGSYLMKNTWPDLKNVFQNILDISKYEKGIKLPMILSENEKK